jgi:hypothetical protein
MAFDSVPWFVGGGAEHSPEIARVLAYAAFNGNEGVLSSTDLAVSALTTPGAAVNVGPGACAILNRATGGMYQAYAARNISTIPVSVAATGATPRSDMIIARVEDPYMAGEPWADPANAKVGPYVFARLISNVPNTATTVAELNLGYSAIPLARIDIPANTATITQAMLRNLRRVANPRRERIMLTVNPTLPDAGPTENTWKNWPDQAQWNVQIPAWATGAVLSWTLHGVRVERNSTTVDGSTYGQTRLRIGGAEQQVTQGASYDIVTDKSISVDRYTIGGGDTRSIPASIRGQTHQIRIQASRSGGNESINVDAGASVVVDVEFFEST